MDAFDQVVHSFRQALASEQWPLPRVTFGAVDRDGSLNYSKSFRDNSGSPDDCPDTDAVHWVASCTKLITTVAVLQCVEKGLLELDQDISTILPEWKHPQVLTGFDEAGQPLFRPAWSTITLRHLLTHSSGMSYSWMHPLLQRYQKLHGPLAPVGQTIKDSYHPFLVCDPGEQWIYSPSIDWAGLMVERVNGGMKLGEYMRRFIFDPLGIRDSAFHLEHREEMRARKGKLWERTPGGLEEMKTPFWSDPITDDMGGGGLYSTVSDLLKLYRGILRGDVLRIETVKAMFLPQLFSTTGLDKPEDIPVNH
ncbi:Beta-lactamase [Fusarium keratoplasticum]|nr:Beta-lactamase [Fusarium keratoplasticum]